MIKIPFVSTNWSWQGKDWVDQPAHLAAGVGLAMLYSAIFPAPVAVVASISAGFTREWLQHPPVFINLDSLVWTAGALYWLTYL